MPEQVNVPGVGKTNRVWVIGGIAAVAGIVVYAYFRRATTPEPLGEGEYAAGDQWSPDAYSGATSPGGETYDPGDVTSDFKLPITNAEWTQRVVDWLVNVAQAAPEFAAATIGKYLSGNPLTASEKTLVQSGIAAVGSPPAGALPIISGPEPTTGAPSGTKLATPKLSFTAGDLRNTIYQLNWTRSTGAAYYLVKRERGPGANPIYGVATGTSRKTGSLQRNWVYQYRVKAQSPGRRSSDWSNPVSWKVPGR